MNKEELLTDEKTPGKQKENEDFAKKGMNLRRVKLKVARHFSSLAPVIEKSNFIDGSENGSVASTDDTNVKMDAGKLAEHSEDEQAAVAAHELKHNEKGDVRKGNGKDGKLWNIATDAVINAELTAGGLPTKIGKISIPNAIQLGAEKIYDMLFRLKTFITQDVSGKKPEGVEGNTEIFTKDEFEKAISGDQTMWQKAMRYLDQKERQKTLARLKPAFELEK